MIVCVYAAGSVPGEFLPGAQAAFLTSATMAALAGVAGLVALATGGVPAEAPEPAGGRPTSEARLGPTCSSVRPESTALSHRRPRKARG